MNKGNGVTFLELIIVMLVLTVFASVIVPQLGKAATEAKVSKLCEILQEVRSFITIYKVQHGQKLPGEGNCSWQEAMCGLTDVNGNLVDHAMAADLDIVLGPYMSEMPVNPYNNLNSLDIDGEIGDDSHGWHFDSETGIFRADNSIEHSQF